MKFSLVVLSLVLIFGASYALQVSEIQAFLKNATEKQLAARVHGDVWLYPAYLGTNFVSQYYVFAHYLGFINKSKIDAARLKKILLETQIHDGSWKQVPELNKEEGELDTTLFHYWALKVMGEDLNAPHMKKARDFIRGKGGIEATTTMTRFFLAVLGQFDWNDIHYIPLIAFRNHSIFYYTFVYNFVAQWIYPHLLPMTYLRYHKVAANLGPKFDLTELWINPKKINIQPAEKPQEPEEDIINIITKMFGVQQKRGSFGAYTVSSLFAIMALKDFQASYPKHFAKEVEDSISRAFAYIEWMYFGIPGGEYMGTLCEGRWWDNVLIALGLADAGVPLKELTRTVDHVIKEALQENGGFAYGMDFEYAADTDDTGLTVTLMSRFGNQYKDVIKKSVDWLISMQNDDGGYGAFDKNKCGSKLIRWAAYSFLDSAELFDQSSVDLTAHILEAWGEVGYTVKDEFVQRAIQYIKNEQTSFYGWEGRWGVNYIYAHGAVIPGLARVGYDLTQDWVKKSIDWLLSKQNQDGGWGETLLSYKPELNLQGVGKSTPSQTAWALLALVELVGLKEYEHVKEPIFRGVEYLIRDYNAKGEWIDESAVGSGHRGILYMQYPAYAKSWPFMALGRIVKRFSNPQVVSGKNIPTGKTDL